MDIVDRLNIKSNMIFLGERIAFGSECELMDEAALEIESLRQSVAEKEAECARYREALEFYADSNIYAFNLDKDLFMTDIGKDCGIVAREALGSKE
jgi:hypothetical protein